MESFHPPVANPDQDSDGSKFNYRLLVGLVFIIFLLVLGSIAFYFSDRDAYNVGKIVNLGNQDAPKMEKFASVEEFQKYLSSSIGSGTIANFNLVAPRAMEESFMALDSTAAPGAGGAGELKRVSDTNVQVAGIDEPDIVKTDGESIFFSNQFFRYFTEPTILEFERAVSSIAPAPDMDYTAPTTKVIDSLPPSELSLTSEIEETGELLLSGNKLIIFSGNQVIAYDLTDRANPTKSWDMKLDDRVNIQTSRLMGDKLLIVARTYAYDTPCPMPLLEGSLTIPCTDIYRPNYQTYADSTFTFMSLNPETGEVTDKISFVGSTSQSVVYVSQDSAYITSSRQDNVYDFLIRFLEANKDLVTSELLSQLKEVQSLSISERAKQVEYEELLSEYLSSLGTDEARRVENEIANRMTDYATEHAREIERTAITKIDISDMRISSTGEVAGNPLNQFSLDEYQGNLRIATTTSGWTQYGRGESVNDLYILDGKLQKIGEVLGMGVDERIYSARFIGDKGYIVTFKQIDPFYVLDLSDPKSPKIKGELKIPGFSSYLHPITDNLIVGVGEENNQTKISLFDVSNPENPTEVSKYSLDEFWSDVQNNHHAFLLDDKHGVFFMPAGQSGYIFSYEGNNLEIERVVSDIQARRAVFINDYLYVIGDEKIVVLSETDWTSVNELLF